MPTERLVAMRLIVTPGTILRWHRDIVRRRWARRSRRGRSGRPATHRKVRSRTVMSAGAPAVMRPSDGSPKTRPAAREDAASRSNGHDGGVAARVSDPEPAD